MPPPMMPNPSAPVDLDALVQLLSSASTGPTSPDPAAAAPMRGEDPLQALRQLQVARVPRPSSLVPGAPDAAGGPSQGQHIDWMKLLAMAAPVIGGATMGRGESGGFLRGYLRGQERLQKDRELKTTQAAAAEEKTYQRTQDTRELQEKLLTEVAKRAADATTPEEHDNIITQGEGIAGQLGLPAGLVRSRFRYTPMRADQDRAKEAKAYLDRLDKDPTLKSVIHTPAFQNTTSHLFRGEYKTPAQLRAIAGIDIQQNGQPYTPTAPKTTLFADLWPAAKGTPMASRPVPLDNDGQPDLKAGTEIARQNGWLSTTGERDAAHSRYVAQVREQVEQAIRVPGSLDPAALKKRVVGAGLSWETERYRAAVAVDRASRDSARDLQLLETVPDLSSEDPAAARERRLATAQSRLDALVALLPDEAKPAGSTPRPAASAQGPARGGPPAPPAARQTITRAELRAAMQGLKAKGITLSEAEAERQYQTRGFTVVP